jgi:hypothetical protein
VDWRFGPPWPLAGGGNASIGNGAPSIPCGGSQNGNYYLDYATGNVYKCNGSSWGSPVATIGGGGSVVKVNGSTLATVNFNGTTPPPPGGNQNCTFQVSGQNVSCFVPTSGGGGTPFNGAQTNCLTSSSCVGGAEYASGVTETNGSTVAVYEQVGMTATGSCTGTDFKIVPTVGGVTYPSSGITNDCNGVASVGFWVPAGQTFSVTAEQISGGTQPFSLSQWFEFEPSSSGGGGGGGGTIPSNATFVFTGNSMNDDDGHVLSSAVTVTGWSTAAGVTTVTNSGTNGFAAGQWVSLRYATGWPTSTPLGAGTGLTLFQVESAGLSGTQFEIATPLISAGTCSSSCGSAYSAASYLPFATTASGGMPSAASAHTYSLVVQGGGCGGATLCAIAAQYSTVFHPLSPAVTGTPGYLIINGPNNDIGFCTSLATIEGYYQTIFSDAHTDGWTVVVGSPTGANFGQNFCNTFYENQILLDEWLRGQGKQTAQAATPGSNEYWDIFTDIGNQLWDGGNTDIIASNQGLGPTGAKQGAITVAADLMNANGRPLPPRQLWWGAPVGTGTTGNNGYMYVPSTGSVAEWRWLTGPSATSPQAEIHTTGGGGGVLSAGSIEGGIGGGCPADWPLCISSGWTVSDTNQMHDVNAIFEDSGGSNLTCFNTNGGVTPCGSTGPTVLSFNSTPLTTFPACSGDKAFQSTQTISLVAGSAVKIQATITRPDTTTGIGIYLATAATGVGSYGLTLQNDGNAVLYYTDSGGSTTAFGASGIGHTYDLPAPTPMTLSVYPFGSSTTENWFEGWTIYAANGSYPGIPVAGDASQFALDGSSVYVFACTGATGVFADVGAVQYSTAPAPW